MTEELAPEPEEASPPAPPKIFVFSPNGLDAYTKACDSYADNLEEASRAVAKHRRSGSIEPFHIQLAIDALGSGDSEGRIARIREVGILMIGAGLGYLSIMISSDTYGIKNLVLTFIFLLIGCTAYAYTWNRAA
jgi:hypothetical protein